MGTNIKNPALISNPLLLVWARETANYSVLELSQKLGLPAERIAQWESGGPISLPQLRKVAEATKRPLPAFFLPQPPSESSSWPLRRTAGSLQSKVTPAVTFAHRRAASLRELAIDLSKQLGLEMDTRVLVTAQGSPAELAAHWAELLQMRMGQTQTTSPRELFIWLRSKLEQLHFLVFQFERISTNDFRGFSIPEPELPVIALNWSDAYSAKNFTLMHELAHVLFQLSGRQFSSYAQEEAECNLFAGQALVPSQQLLEIAKKQNHWRLEEVAVVAKQFKVSREVIARRLVDVGLAEPALYLQIRSLNLPAYDKEAPKNDDKPTGGLPRHTVALSLLGKSLPSIVLSGYANHLVTLNEATDQLGLKTKHLPKLYEALAR